MVTTRILEPSPDNVLLAAKTIRSGGLVAIPTETVYGLAGSAFDEHAVASIFAVKERPTFDPIIVHVARPPWWGTARDEGRLIHLAESAVVDVASLGSTARERVGRLIEIFWPGPLTLVLPRARGIPYLVTAGLETVAVRMPRHPVAQALLEATGVPLAAPSANRFGRLSPTTAAHVASELGGRVGLVLDGGPCAIGLESTVLAVAADGGLALLRPGGVPRALIEDATGCPVVVATDPAVAEPPSAPGMLASHYAPSKRLVILPAAVPDIRAEQVDSIVTAIGTAKRVGLLLASGHAGRAAAMFQNIVGRPAIVVSLSPDGNAETAARALFRCLRALDNSDADVLLAEPWPDDVGLGHAITDRLNRAAGLPRK